MKFKHELSQEIEGFLTTYGTAPRYLRSLERKSLSALMMTFTVDPANRARLHEAASAVVAFLPERFAARDFSFPESNPAAWKFRCYEELPETERHFVFLEVLYEEFKQYIERCRSRGQKFRYCCVAEAHKNGDLHLHAAFFPLDMHGHPLDMDIIGGVQTAAGLGRSGEWTLGYSTQKVVYNVDARQYLTKYLTKGGYVLPWHSDFLGVYPWKLHEAVRSLLVTFGFSPKFALQRAKLAALFVAQSMKDDDADALLTRQSADRAMLVLHDGLPGQWRRCLLVLVPLLHGHARGLARAMVAERDRLARRDAWVAGSEDRHERRAAESAKRSKLRRERRKLERGATAPP